MSEFKLIYKRDNKGKVRQWRAETMNEGDQSWYRTVSGLIDGAQVTSEWKEAFPKNVGKKNATTSETQAISEVESMYEDRMSKGYFENINDIDTFTKFKPMLASDYTKLKKPIDFEENRVLCQPKLDGIRCIARADGLWTRAGKEIVSCPHIMEALTTYFDENPDDILDGELYNHELKADFNKITSLVRKTKPTKEDIEECAEKVQYHIYDGIIDEPYHEFFSSRFFWIKDELRNAPDCIQTVKTCGVDSIEMLDELYGTYLTDGYEGQMVRYDAMYENKRSKYLMKRKEFITEEFPVVGVEEGKGNWSGHVKIFRVEYAPGKVCGAGVRGDQATLKKLFESDVPDWCTLRYFEPTPDGVPRFPVVIDWGYGKRQD